MFDSFLIKLEPIKAKIAGARKSVTVAVIAVWQAIIQNTDSIQAMIPQLPQYFSEHMVSIISGVFGVILLYVRLFHTSGAIEDKNSPKSGG
jgi:hypothetical protein